MKSSSNILKTWSTIFQKEYTSETTKDSSLSQSDGVAQTLIAKTYNLTLFSEEPPSLSRLEDSASKISESDLAHDILAEADTLPQKEHVTDVKTIPTQPLVTDKISHHI